MICFTILLVLCFFAGLIMYPQSVPAEERSCLGWIGVLTVGTVIGAISLWIPLAIVAALLGG